MKPRASRQLLSTISGLRDRGDFTDLILKHNIESFHVHRVIICPQSKVFHKACTGEFQEKSTGIIDLGHLNHVELKKMVHFFYSMDYDDEMPDGVDMSPLQLYTRMFALADLYGISSMSAFAVEKYTSRCDAAWMPTEFLASIHDVYETTPSCVKTMRELVCKTIREHLPSMLDSEDVAEMFERVLVERTEFANDLLKSYVSSSLYGHCTACGSDQPMEALQARCKKCGKGASSLRSFH